MRLKLIYPAQPFLLSEVPRPDGSLGLLYIAAALREAGHEVSLLDMAVGDATDSLQNSFFRHTPIDETTVRVGLSPAELQERLAGCNAVAVSSIFTMNTSEAFEIAAAAKRVDKRIWTIAGGGNAKALHRLFLDNGFDILVCGEGEATIVELCRVLETHGDLSQVRGIAFKGSNGDVVMTEPRPAETQLDRLPMPAWDLLPLDKYWEIGDPPGGAFEPGRRVRYLTMQTSRGCPYRCTYCHISRAGDAARLRLKSDERVLQELAAMKQLGAEHVLLQDDSLLADRDRMLRLLPQFRASGLGFSDTNGINVSHLFRNKGGSATVDVELLEAMWQSGMTDFALAFESGSRRVLTKYSTRKWDPERHNAEHLVRAVKDRGLQIQGFFTIGYPDETYEELDETFMLARRLVDAGLKYAYFYVVTPYPGTALYEMALKNGHLPADLDLTRMKFQVPTLVNTVVPSEVVRYCRRLAYKLIHSADRVAAKDRKTAAVSGAKRVG